MIGKVLAQAVTLPDYAGTGFKFAGMKLGDILSALLPYIYAIAGIGLLAMIILGGVEIMTSAGDQNKMKSGQGRLTSAAVGFGIIFVSYFLAQIVEVVLGIKIL